MRKLRNSLYVIESDSYLALNGETIIIRGKDDEVLGKVPLRNLEDIISFGYRGVSPALMRACVQRHIIISFLSPNGQFMARLQGGVQGNVYLREKQYLLLQKSDFSLDIAKNCILGKLYNSKSVIDRVRRDHGFVVDLDKLTEASDKIRNCIQKVTKIEDTTLLRAVESEGARVFFRV